MPRYSTIFNVVLIASLSLPIAAAGSPEQAERSVAIGTKADATATDATVGRFTMTAYRETLVLLDTATGHTWLLKASGDAESLSWTPLERDVNGTFDMLAVAEAATEGRVEAQRVPELGVIILRGSKEDVEAAKNAIDKKEQGGRTMPQQ